VYELLKAQINCTRQKRDHSQLQNLPKSLV